VLDITNAAIAREVRSFSLGEGSDTYSPLVTKAHGMGKDAKDSKDSKDIKDGK
jgi:hypothetical protein